MSDGPPKYGDPGQPGHGSNPTKDNPPTPEEPEGGWSAYAGQRSPQHVDRTPAEAARDEAIERVDDAAPEEWKDHAFSVVSKVCETHETFTTDDIWMRLEWKPPERRAISPVLLKAARMGLCTAMGEHRKSSSVKCHARPKRVWRSLVYEA